MSSVVAIDFNKGLVAVQNEERTYTNYSLDEIELMQSSNLKDKNGKEIYDGDIVYTDEADFFDQVVFKKGAFYIETLLNRPFDDELLSDTTVEIIGNVYENAYLMEDNGRVKMME